MGLFLPVSKSDAGGASALRRLRCQCRGRVDRARRCGPGRVRKRVGYLKKTLAARKVPPRRQATWPLFGMRSGAHAPKIATLRGWRVFDPFAVLHGNLFRAFSQKQTGVPSLTP